MSAATRGPDHAFALMSLDIVKHVLREPENLQGAVDHVMEVIRELTGARLVIMTRRPRQADDAHGYSLLGFTPSRHRALVESDVVAQLLRQAQDFSEPTPLHADLTDSEDPVVAPLTKGLNLAIPLKAGTTHVGAMVVLGLVDDRHVESVIEMQRTISEVLAIILRSCFLIDELGTMEETLRSREEQIRLLLESTAEAICGLDVEGKCTFANRACVQFLGYESADDLVGKKIHDLIHHSHADGKPYPAEECPIYRSLSKGEEAHVDDDVLWRAGGTSFPVEYRSHPVRHDGQIVGAVFTFLDVTDRRKAEEEQRKIEAQIQQAQKLESLGVLAGGIAHDFNNLLMTILGNADLALIDLSPVAPARKSIEEVVKAARRAAELSQQMLAYSGKGRFVVEKVSLSEIVAEMGHLLEVSTSKKAVVRYRLGENLPAIEADVAQIRQVVMNLITNASDAIGEKSGVISITTDVMECDRAYLAKSYLRENLPEGMYAYVEVADTGCGMDKETQQKIFDPFFSTKFTGRGLGLAAVLGIIRGHKGAIRVYSEPGRGTTFKVLFPVTDQPADPLEKETGRDKDWRGSGTMLLVDDEDTIRILGKCMLERLGFSVLTAEDGRQAVETYRQHAGEITAVILDLSMPHMDGEEAVREQRRIDETVRVILSSGYAETEITERFAGKGIAGFIAKPYRLAQLRAKVRQVLEGSDENEDDPGNGSLTD